MPAARSINVPVGKNVIPLSILYSNGLVPPEAATSILPFASPQVGSVLAILSIIGPAWSLIVTDCDTIQPFASCTTISYEPAESPLMVFAGSKVTPLSILYSNGEVPPDAIISILPSAFPQVASVTVVLSIITAAGSVISADVVVSQLLASVIVTTYVPAASPVGL